MSHAKLENIMLESIYANSVILPAINALVHLNLNAQIVWREISEKWIIWMPVNAWIISIMMRLIPYVFPVLTWFKGARSAMNIDTALNVMLFVIWVELHAIAQQGIKAVAIINTLIV